MRTLIVLLLLLAATRAAAQDDTWLLQANVSPDELLTDGAVLTDIDTMVWADGRMVSVTYWLAPGDLVYRCAAIVPDASPNPSCWRREFVAAGATPTAMSTVRSISTRRRAIWRYVQPYAPSPHVWVGVAR